MLGLIIKFSLPIVILFSLLFFPQELSAYKNEDDGISYENLIQLYTEWLDLERHVFKKLSFRLSSSQIIKEGYNIKFILEDNLGKKWIFKPNYFVKEHHSYPLTIKSSLLVYRFYKLFGVKTPQIHYISLYINDKKISGTLQEFIPSKGDLSSFTTNKLTSFSRDYLLKSHAIDWLLANYEADARHFLVLSLNKQGLPKEIMRIDNENAFLLLNKDILRYDWWKTGDTWYTNRYYYVFYRDYVLKNIRFDISKSYSFVKFIYDFPDYFIEKLILFIREDNLSQLPQISDIPSSFSSKILVKSITARKHCLLEDFKKFYLDLAQARKESVIFCEDADIKEIIVSIIKDISSEIRKLKEEDFKLAKSTSYPAKMNLVFSLEGLIYLQKLYAVCRYGNKKDLIPECELTFKKLTLLRDSTKNKNERKAIEKYLHEVKRIRLSKTCLSKWKDLNNLIATSIVSKK